MKKKKVDDENGFGEWGGYMNAKVSKLEEQFADDAANNPYKESNLFDGISIFVNGLTNPSSDELKRIMMTHGGTFHTYHRSFTTYIIASNLPDVKIRQLTTAKIISPQWIVDCLKEKRILDYSKYLLYTNAKTSQPTIQFAKKARPAETITAPRPSEPTAASEAVNDEPEVDLNSTIAISLDMLNTVLREDSCDFLDDKPTAGTSKPSIMNTTSKHSAASSTRTAVDPTFLSEFYNNSRLHHIATLGASFKDYVSRLREAHDGQYLARTELRGNHASTSSSTRTNRRKAIMHIDMDCFFVSVGLRSRPHLRGQPIAVTHSKGANSNQIKQKAGADREKEMQLYAKRHTDKYRMHELNDDEPVDRPTIDTTTSLSEIASCSYEARRMGVKNGMFVGAALKLCPQLKTIPYDFDGYKEVAQVLYDTVTQYTLDVEAVSCDEMYVDLTDLLCDVNMTPLDFVTHLRNEISTKTGCPCSAGIGANRLQARMATKEAKPNGQYFLEEHVEEYFQNILISDLPGVGYSTTTKLNQLNWKTCYDLQQLTLVRIQQELGKKLGETLNNYCRGIDNKPLTFDQIRKSVSAEVNYGIRFSQDHELNTFLRQLCTEVHNRLVEIRAKGKTITLKYMVRAKDAPVETAKFMGHGFCDHVTKSVTLNSFTCDLDAIMQNVFTIKDNLNIAPNELRGIGIQISKLNTGVNDSTKSNVLRNMFEKATERNQTGKRWANKDTVPKCTISHAASPRKEPVPSKSPRKATASKSNKTLRKVKSFNSSSDRDIKQMFTNLPSTSAATTNCNDKIHEMYQELDINVLAELPEDIREQVLQEQMLVLKNRIPMVTRTRRREIEGRQPHNNRLESTSTTLNGSSNDRNDSNINSSNYLNLVDSTESDDRPCDVSSNESKEKNEEPVENVLLRPNWLRTLTEWLESTDDPIECDIDIVANFFESMMFKQLFGEVRLRLKFLHRVILPKTCQWHQFFYRIVSLVQSLLVQIRGENIELDISTDLNCKICRNV